MRKINLILMFCFIQFSCTSDAGKKSMYYNLVKKDYDQFRGLSIFVREYEFNGNPVIYLHDYSIGYNICGYKYFITKGVPPFIVESGIHKYSDTCRLAISLVDSLLVKDFASMKIRRLMVKKAGSIFISTNSLEEFDLVKLVNYNDSNEKYKSWISLGQNWYHRP